MSTVARRESEPREVTHRGEISETISNSDHDDPMSTSLSSDEIGMGAKSGDGLRRSTRQKRAPNWYDDWELKDDQDS